VLVEFDDDLADKAKKRAAELALSSIDLQVMTGDAVQKLDRALSLISKWSKANKIASLVVSIQALLHELPDRGSQSTDLVAFLGRFTTLDVPVLMVVREPCAPRDLPQDTFLSANCSVENLLAFVNRIRAAHAEFMVLPEPIRVKDAVRLASLLAAEAIVKLFYIDSFNYELEERVTSFGRDELVGLFCRVFGTDNVRHTDLQSDSFERFWKQLGLKVTDGSMKECVKPQLHVQIIAKFFPARQQRPKSRRRDEKNDQGIQDRDSNQSGTGGVLASSPTPKNDPVARPLSGMPTDWLRETDILTPSPSFDRLSKLLRSRLGGESARNLMDLGRRAVLAVEEGDFSAHLAIGDALVLLAKDLPPLESAGHYFKGEGFRLLADLSANTAKRNSLLKAAENSYNVALGLDPNSIRSTRGLARVLEVKEELGQAVMLFERSKGMALQAINSPTEEKPSLLLMHEILRVTRHHVNCILEIRAKSPRSVWNRDHKTSELEGYLFESENRHREYLRNFDFQPAWQQIEWFMALVFFAKAWYELGKAFRGDQHALNALALRRRLMSSTTTLTATEVENLLWWTRVVKSAATRGSAHDLLQGADRIAPTIETGNVGETLRAVDQVVRLAKPLWSR
jgi:hypothetical protein